MSNAHYWVNRNERSTHAKTHTKEMSERYPEDISACIAGTKIYDGSQHVFECVEKESPMQPQAWQTTTDGALFALPDETLGLKTAVLNFASYKNPGGMFIEGSMAQEEALCHGSFLYNVLSSTELAHYYEWNRKNLNRGLYKDRALYTPGVAFISSTGEVRKADVLTCAAPNNSMPENVPGIFREEENRAALTSRMIFIRNILHEENVDRVILGAWGCGVFRQDPGFVSKKFLEVFDGSGIECIYAVPDQKTYDVFRREVDLECGHMDFCRDNGDER